MIAPAYTYRATVVSNYDGDTLTLDVDLGFGMVFSSQKIRLLGVDTPELKGATRAEGLAARDMTCRMCPAGARVILESFRDRKEKFGRWLGRVHLEDGRCVNDVLRAAGYTRDY